MLRWTGVVLLNSVVGLYFGLGMSDTTGGYFGVVLGIAIWLVLYVIADYQLLKFNKPALSRRLTYSALLRSVLQCYPMLDLFVGLFAIGTYEWLFSASINITGSSDPLPHPRVRVDFNVTLILTLLTGLYLSVVCALFFVIISWGSFFVKKIKGMRGIPS